MSTPRTDKELKYLRTGDGMRHAVVDFDFARSLENELNAATDKLAKVARCVAVVEAWDESHTDKQVELSASFSEAMSYDLWDKAEARIAELEGLIISAMPALSSLLEDAYGTSDPEKLKDDEEWWPALKAAAPVKKEGKP